MQCAVPPVLRTFLVFLCMIVEHTSRSAIVEMRTGEDFPLKKATIKAARLNAHIEIFCGEEVIRNPYAIAF